MVLAFEKIQNSVKSIQRDDMCNIPGIHDKFPSVPKLMYQEFLNIRMVIQVYKTLHQGFSRVHYKLCDVMSL